MNTPRTRGVRVLGNLLWLALAAGIGAAQTFTTVPFAYNSEISPVFPTGSMTMGGIPFSSPTSGFNFWTANIATGPNPRTLEITTNRYAVSRVYTLISTHWGQTGGPYAWLEFWGDNGAYHRKDLYGNVDIRDFFQNGRTNDLNGATSVNVFSGPAVRLDRQRIELPAAFADQALVRIRLSDNGATDFQRVFLHGLTVESQYSAGSMAQLASAGTWKTTITLLNPGTTAAAARLRFFDNIGGPLRLPLTFSAGAPQVTAQLERTLQPGAALLVETTGPDAQPVDVGWMELNGTGSITGFAVFRQKIGDTENEAVVPLESRDPQAFVLWFDNTAGYSTGVAIANTAPQAATIGVVIRDDTGRVLLDTSLPLSARGHTSFSLATQYAVTAGTRGTVEFRKPPSGVGPVPQISVLGLRFNPRGSFTTVPAVSR